MSDELKEFLEYQKQIDVHQIISKLLVWLWSQFKLYGDIRLYDVYSQISQIYQKYKDYVDNNSTIQSPPSKRKHLENVFNSLSKGSLAQQEQKMLDKDSTQNKQGRYQLRPRKAQSYAKQIEFEDDEYLDQSRYARRSRDEEQDFFPNHQNNRFYRGQELQNGLIFIQKSLSPKDLLYAALKKFQFHYLSEIFEVSFNYGSQDQSDIRDIRQCIVNKVTYCRIPEALFVIDDILSMVNKCLELIPFAKKLINKMSGTNYCQYNFSPLKHLQDRQIVEFVLAFIQTKAHLFIGKANVNKAKSKSNNAANKRKSYSNKVLLNEKQQQRLENYLNQFNGQSSMKREKQEENETWSSKDEQYLLKRAKELGQNCMKFVIISHQIANGRYSQEFLKSKFNKLQKKKRFQ